MTEIRKGASLTYPHPRTGHRSAPCSLPAVSRLLKVLAEVLRLPTGTGVAVRLRSTALPSIFRPRMLLWWT
jgi:hypothetical protein